MLADHLVGDRQEAPIGTFEAFYAGFVAQAADPFVGASRPVAGSTSLAALEPAGINILSPTEQGAEEVDFGSEGDWFVTGPSALVGESPVLRTESSAVNASGVTVSR